MTHVLDGLHDVGGGKGAGHHAGGEQSEVDGGERKGCRLSFGPGSGKAGADRTQMTEDAFPCLLESGIPIRLHELPVLMTAHRHHSLEDHEVTIVSDLY